MVLYASAQVDKAKMASLSNAIAAGLFCRLQFVKLFWKWKAVPLPFVEHHFHDLAEEHKPSMSLTGAARARSHLEAKYRCRNGRSGHGTASGVVKDARKSPGARG